jgi:hypothetical protein
VTSRLAHGSKLCLHMNAGIHCQKGKMDDLSSMPKGSGVDGEQGQEGDFTLTPMSSCTDVPSAAFGRNQRRP